MHKDNTFKALKGEEMFVERWLCKVGLHRWAKWSAPEKHSYYVIQRRNCADCGQHGVRRVKEL